MKILMLDSSTYGDDVNIDKNLERLRVIPQVQEKRLLKE